MSGNMAKQKSRAAKAKSKPKPKRKIAGRRRLPIQGTKLRKALSAHFLLPAKRGPFFRRKKRAVEYRNSTTKIKRETFTLPSPVPREFHSARIAPPEEPQPHVLSHPARTAVKHHPKKDAIPAPLTAMAGALIITALVAAFLMLALGMNPLYTIGISMAIFVGFSIVFYTIIETAE